MSHRYERYAVRRYWQAVCRHECHILAEGPDYHTMRPRLRRAVAEVDVTRHAHPPDVQHIVSYECVGGLDPDPDDQPEIIPQARK